MLRRLRERSWRLLAEALPASLAYWAAKRVLAHAALTRYARSKVADIKALEAIDHWADAMFPAKPAPRTRQARPGGAPLWRASTSDAGPILPRDVQAPEMLEAVEAERLEEVRVVSEVKPTPPAGGQGA